MDAPLTVFISYHSSEGHHAGSVKALLEREGFSCFLAHEDLKVSTEWRDRIWEELKHCDCFVGLVSEASNSSVWCQQESAVALCRLPPERFVFVKLGTVDPQGFCSKFQALPVGKLLTTLDDVPMIHENRLNTMIDRLGEANSYQQAREIGRPVLGVIDQLTPGQIERLLRVSLTNRQVWDASGIGTRVQTLYEGYKE
jgi:hypothetical protein